MISEKALGWFKIAGVAFVALVFAGLLWSVTRVAVTSGELPDQPDQPDLSSGPAAKDAAK